MGRRSLLVRTALLSALATSQLAYGVVAATPDAAQFCGYAFDLKGGQFRYVEHHQLKLDGDRWMGGSIDYIAADGSAIGRKTLSFESNPLIPVYRLELLGGRYIEGIERVDSSSVLAYRKEFSDSEIKRETISYTAPASADSGFHSLIKANLADLVAGKKQRFGFIVAGALDQYKFRVRRDGESTFEGRPAVRLLAEPDTWLRLLVDPLDLVYDPANGQLLEYRGPTNLRDPQTLKGFDVHITYSARVPDGVPPAAASVCSRGR